MGTEEVRGRTCWVIEFEPRDGRLQRPFRWLLGLVGTLRHATGQFDFQRLEPNLWMPAVSRIEFDVGVLFGLKSIRRRIRTEWLEHRPAGISAALP